MKGFYKIIDDLSVVEQEGLFKESFYLLGSESKNSYIKVPIELVDYCKDIIDKLDGNHSINEITGMLLQKYGKDIDVFAFVKKLSEAGLIEGFDKQIDAEMDILGLTLIRKDFNSFNKIYKIFCALSNLVYSIFKYYKIVLFIIFSEIIYIFFYVSSDIFTLRRIFIEIDATMLNSVVIWLLTGLSFFLHELGHAAAAVANNITIKTFSFGLHMGLIPMFYFTYYNLKSAPPKVKLRVTVAGIYANLICVGVCLLLLNFFVVAQYVREILKILIVLNTYMIAVNLLPFRLSDGYYILTLFLNKYDLRITLIKFLTSPKSISNINPRERKIIISYAIFSSAIFILTIYSLCTFVSNCFLSGNYICGILVTIVFSSTIILTIKNIISKSKRGKKY